LVNILREANQSPVAKVVKKYGISGATIYAWCRWFRPLEALEMKCLRQLEHENARVKKRVA
jgi:putative transposase